MRIILFIGQHKTGSSALQSWLAAAAPHLIRRGILYPAVEAQGARDIDHLVRRGSRPEAASNIPVNRREAHNALAFALLSEADPDHRIPDLHRNLPDPDTMFATIRAQCARHRPQALILASEVMANFGQRAPEAIPRLLANLPEGEITLTATLRRVDDYLVSWQGQRLRFGERIASLPAGGMDSLLDSIHVNYRRMLEPWLEHLPENRLRLRSHDEVMNSGGAVADFLAGFDIDPIPGLPADIRLNTGLHRGLIEIARAGVHTLPTPQVQALIRHLLDVGPRLGLPDPVEVEMFGRPARQRLAAAFAPAQDWVERLAGRHLFPPAHMLCLCRPRHEFEITAQALVQLRDQPPTAFRDFLRALDPLPSFPLADLRNTPPECEDTPSGRRLIVHIGQHKTGSTAIQEALATGRFQVPDRRILYTARMGHNYLRPQVDLWCGITHAAPPDSADGSPQISGPQRPGADPGVTLDPALPDLAELARICAAPGHADAVISAEELEGVPPAALARMLETLFLPGAGQLQIMAWVRPHADRLRSSFAEQIKIGLFGGIPQDFLARQIRGNRLLQSGRLASWGAVFGPALRLRPLIAQHLAGGSVVQDFATEVWGPDALITAGPDLRANPSPCLEDLVLLRHLQDRLADLPRLHRHALGWDLADRLQDLPRSGTRTPFRLDRALVEQIRDHCLEDARQLDGGVFAACPGMEDALDRALDEAPSNPLPLDPEAHFNAEELRQVGILADTLRTLALRPEGGPGLAAHLHARRVDRLHGPATNKLCNSTYDAAFIAGESDPEVITPRPDPALAQMGSGAVMLLQRLIAIEPEIGLDPALWFHSAGPVLVEGCTLLFRAGAEIWFDGYMSILDLTRWTAACTLPNLYLTLSGSGSVHLQLTRVESPNGRSELLLARHMDLCADGHSHDIGKLLGLAPFGEGATPPPQGCLILRITARGEGHLKAGAWTCVTPPQLRSAPIQQGLPEPPTLPPLPLLRNRIALIITTFRREAEVARNTTRILNFLDTTPALPADVRLLIIDNGNSLVLPSHPLLHILPNRNLGGAGGFARGLSVAIRQGFTHAVFMDDDALVPCESLLRMLAVLHLARDPAIALAGAMLPRDRPWMVWENGAVFDRLCRPRDHGTDLRDPHALLRMLTAPRLTPPGSYGGWWFLAFPLAAIRAFPFPFFLRGDDISFSLANRLNIQTLPGVLALQEDFAARESPLSLYLDLRSHLHHHLVHPKLEIPAPASALIALGFLARCLMRMHYDSGRAVLMAWADVLRGPTAFAESPDLAARRAMIATLTRTEAWQPTPALIRSRDLRAHSPEDCLPPRRWPALLLTATLNGHLVPFWGWIGGRRRVPIQWRAATWPLLGAREALFIDRTGARAYRVRHSKRRAAGLILRAAGLCLLWLIRHSSLRRAHRAAYPRLTGHDWWQGQFTRPDHNTEGEAAPDAEGMAPGSTLRG